jgi:hypothetical protein
MDGGNKFKGTILPTIGLDEYNRGRYLVHIKEEHPHLSGITDGIWCRNRTHPWRWNTDFIVGSYGSYYPLQPGTRVVVEFTDDNRDNGDIVSILADQDLLVSSPIWITQEQRDMVTIPFKTPYFYNIMQINELTTGFGNPLGNLNPIFGQPYNSIHFYYNTDVLDDPAALITSPGTLPAFKEFCGETDDATASKTNIRTKYIINEDGVHFQTADNLYVSIDQDGHIAINGNTMIKLKKNVDIHIEGGDNSTKVLIDGTVDVHIKKATKVKIDDNCDIRVTGDTKIWTIGDTHILSSGLTHIDASRINLNCGTSAVAAKAEDAKDTKGYNEKDPTDKELVNLSRAKDVTIAAPKMMATLI